MTSLGVAPGVHYGPVEFQPALEQRFSFESMCIGGGFGKGTSLFWVKNATLIVSTNFS